MQIAEVIFLEPVLLKAKTASSLRRADKYRILWDGTHRGILIEQPEPGSATVFVPFSNVRQMQVEPDVVNNDGRKKVKDGESTGARPSS